jgi:uncharacterized protein YqcC (DUF446 family)
MPDKIAILAKLDEVEAEMKSIGFWADNPKENVDGKIKNYLDASSFELWLQTVFLPNARVACKTGNFPNQSQVGLMALRQYDYHSSVPKAHRLMNLLSQFDKLFVPTSH